MERKLNQKLLDRFSQAMLIRLEIDRIVYPSFKEIKKFTNIRELTVLGEIKYARWTNGHVEELRFYMHLKESGYISGSYVYYEDKWYYFRENKESFDNPHGVFI